MIGRNNETLVCFGTLFIEVNYKYNVMYFCCWPNAGRWPRRRPPPRRAHRFTVPQPPPTTVDCVKPLVERHVLTCLGLAYSDELSAAGAHTTSARYRDTLTTVRCSGDSIVLSCFFCFFCLWTW